MRLTTRLFGVLAFVAVSAALYGGKAESQTPAPAQAPAQAPATAPTTPPPSPVQAAPAQPAQVPAPAQTATPAPPPVEAPKYPQRAVELIVPGEPGGDADQLARLVSKLIEPMLKQHVPVVNVSGEAGAAGMAKLLAAPADGYSMAIYIADSHALLAGKHPRWKIGDITPLAVMVKVPSFIFVKEDSRFKNWTEFANVAKTNPGKLKVATVGAGGIDDFSLAGLARRDVKITQVPFSKPSERYKSILDGRADALYDQPSDVSRFVQGKQMRPILVFGTKRLGKFKDVPCSYELGYKIALPQFQSIVVRSGTPSDVTQTLSEMLTKVAATPEFKKFLEAHSADPDSFEASSKAAAFVARQLEEMKKTMATN